MTRHLNDAATTPNMQQTLSGSESQFSILADTYTTDPAFDLCRADETLWNVTVSDDLENS